MGDNSFGTGKVGTYFEEEIRSTRIKKGGRIRGGADRFAKSVAAAQTAFRCNCDTDFSFFDWFPSQCDQRIAAFGTFHGKLTSLF